jgi:hypothetical protein
MHGQLAAQPHLPAPHASHNCCFCLQTVRSQVAALMRGQLAAQLLHMFFLATVAPCSHICYLLHGPLTAAGIPESSGGPDARAARCTAKRLGWA